MVKIPTILILSGLLILSSCATMVEKYSSKENYTVLKSVKRKASLVSVTLKERKAKGTSFVHITSPLIPAATLIAKHEQVSDNSGDRLVLSIEKVRFFTSWYNGWTEAEYEATGKLILENKGNEYSCKVADPIELWDILKGQVRYYDAFYRDEEGIQKAKNRVDRLIEFSSFLKNQGFPGHFGHFSKEAAQGPSFKSHIVPYLFPETKGPLLYQAKKGKLYRGVEITREDIEARDIEINSGFIWNKKYTEAILPPELAPLRDSGTIWRDYEEGGKLFFTLYNLDYFYNTLLGETVFTKKQY